MMKPVFILIVIQILWLQDNRLLPHALYLAFQNVHRFCHRNCHQLQATSSPDYPKKSFNIDKDNFKKILEKVKEYDSEWLKETLGDDLIEMLLNDTTPILSNENRSYFTDDDKTNDDDEVRGYDNYRINLNQLVQPSNLTAELPDKILSDDHVSSNESSNVPPTHINPVNVLTEDNSVNQRLLELGYKHEEVELLKASVKKIIIERSVIRPSKGLPSIWLQTIPAETNQEQSPRADKLPNRQPRKSNNSNRSSKISTDYSSEAATKGPSVAWRNGPEPKNRQYEDMDDAVERDYSTSGNNLFWPDKEEFKDLLLEESRWRASLVGDFWLPTIKQEAKWRYFMYKKWKEFLDQGVSYGFENVDMPKFAGDEEYEDEEDYADDEVEYENYRNTKSRYEDNREPSQERRRSSRSDVFDPRYDRREPTEDIDQPPSPSSEQKQPVNAIKSQRVSNDIDTGVRRDMMNEVDDKEFAPTPPARTRASRFDDDFVSRSRIDNNDRRRDPISTSRSQSTEREQSRSRSIPSGRRDMLSAREREREQAYDEWLKRTLREKEGWTDLSSEQKNILLSRQEARFLEKEYKRRSADDLLDKDDWFADLDSGRRRRSFDDNDDNYDDEDYDNKFWDKDDGDDEDYLDSMMAVNNMKRMQARDSSSGGRSGDRSLDRSFAPRDPYNTRSTRSKDISYEQFYKEDKPRPKSPPLSSQIRATDINKRSSMTSGDSNDRDIVSRLDDVSADSKSAYKWSSVSEKSPLQQQRDAVMSTVKTSQKINNQFSDKDDDNDDDEEDHIRHINAIAEEETFREIWEASAARKPIN